MSTYTRRVAVAVLVAAGALGGRYAIVARDCAGSFGNKCFAPHDPADVTVGVVIGLACGLAALLILAILERLVHRARAHRIREQ